MLDMPYFNINLLPNQVKIIMKILQENAINEKGCNILLQKIHI